MRQENRKLNRQDQFSKFSNRIDFFYYFFLKLNQCNRFWLVWINLLIFFYFAFTLGRAHNQNHTHCNGSQAEHRIYLPISQPSSLISLSQISQSFHGLHFSHGFGSDLECCDTHYYNSNQVFLFGFISFVGCFSWFLNGS